MKVTKQDVDRAIKVAIAGTTVAMAAATEGGVTSLIKVTPECLKVLDDSRKFGELFRRAGKVKANPLWLEEKLFQGEADAASPFTIDYLRGRRLKKMGSSAVGIGGIVSSSHTAGINAPGIAKESNASVTTMTHMAKIGGIGLAHMRVAEVQTWVQAIIALKSIKLAIRGTKLAAAAVPAMSFPASIATEFVKLGVEMTVETLCSSLASEIHHTAFLEMIHKNGQGPASEIVRELFTKRGATRFFGSYDANHYIAEPGGWKAVADKLALI